MKKLKGFMLLMFCCLFSAVIALSACSSKGDTSTSSSDGGTSSTTDSSSVDVSSSGGDSSSVDDSSSDGGSSDASSSDDGSSSGGSSSSADETNYDTMLESITVDASGAKTSYALGEEFSSEGIVVNATTSVNFLTSTSAVTGYTVDSSNFDSSKVGTYTIYVTYALPANPQAFQNAEYTVTVSSSLPAYANISVAYSGDQQLTYSTSGVTIDLSSEKLTVTSHIGNDAANLTEATVTDYELYYSVNGSTEKAVENNAITATDTGVYSIYAVKDYLSGTESIEMRAQLLIYVVDTAQSLTKIEGGTTSYDYGATNIGSDWTYTVTFASGATTTISYSDVEIEASSSSGSQTATVTYVYSYTGIKNGEVTTVSATLTTTVAYTVAAASLGEAIVFKTAALSAVDDFSEVSYSAGTVITSNDLFSLESTLATKTSIGKNSGTSYLLQEVKSGYTFSYTDLSGATVSPDQGIKLSTAVDKDADSGTAFTLTAKSDCVVEVYLSIANDSYNSDRAGTIYYAIDGTKSTTTYDVTTRTSVVTVSVTLKANQVLTIGAAMNATDTAKIWLFGAAAKSVS